MNLRTLKVRSRQAKADLIRYWGFQEHQFFKADRDCHCGLDFKRFPRCQWAFVSRDGKSGWIHPRPNTDMWGETQGYYEPEWDEETALEHLQGIIALGGKPKECPFSEYQRICKYCRMPCQTDEQFEASWQAWVAEFQKSRDLA